MGEALAGCFYAIPTMCATRWVIEPDDSNQQRLALEMCQLAVDTRTCRRKGDLGAVVMVYEPDGIEVEFVRVSGATQALVTLRLDDVRPVGDEDLVAMRPPEDTE